MSAAGSLTCSDSEGGWEVKQKSSVTVCHVVLACRSLGRISVPENHFVFTYLMFLEVGFDSAECSSMEGWQEF